ncbi:MAG: adenylate kinase family protein [Verrucomicrobiales bacterium]
MKNARQPSHLVFLGPPASGKGTQGRRLADELGLAYLSTGGFLREILREGGEAASQVKPYLDRGHYVPDEIMLPLVRAWMSRHADGWVLDGFPRTLAQAEELDALLDPVERRSLRAVCLEVPEAELRKRVASRVECLDCHWTAGDSEIETCAKCGGRMAPRADDDLEKFARRYEEFRTQALPAIKFYQESGRALTLDGLSAPDQVYQDLRSALDKMTDS